MQKKLKIKNNYTVIIFSIFIISISCLIFIEKAQAASFYFENQLNGYIEPKPATSTAFTLPIHISEADDVNRIKISIDFKHPNSDVVFYDGYEILDFFSSSTCPLTATSSIATTTETSMIEIDIQRSCGSGITGSGDVINLIFHASTTPGTTEVSSPSANVYKTGTTTAEYSSFSRALIYIEGYDYINPVISNVHISGNSYKASELYLSWETDEPTIGQVSYRPAMVGESYITTALTEIYSTSTSMTITNLIPDTRYEFRINSYDLNENADLSYNHSFKTYAADTISFASNYYLYSENKDIPLEINIENVNNPNYIDFTFNYDPAVAEFKNIVLGDFFSDCVIASSSENTTGTVVVELTNNCATSTSGLLATINIKSLFVTSACDLTFTNGETRASNDSVIESFWNDSSLGVVSTDISPPEITLTGANPMYLDYSEYYSEPGFTVTDNIDDESQISTSTNIHISYFSSGSDYITYTATDKAGNTATATRTVIVRNPTIPPEITLEGDNPMYIDIEQWYIEPGYSASDDIDGDITDDVNLEGIINTWAPGTYNLTYTVTDSSNNTTVATRTIIVRASTNQPPEITLEGDNPMYIDIGQWYIEPGYSASDDIDGDITDDVNLEGIINTWAPGTYNLTYTVTDSSDNTTVATRTVIIRQSNTDTIPPEISLLGYNPMYIDLGDIYEELGYSATDNIDGVIPIENIATSSNLNASTTGSYYVTYTVSDISGNTAIATRTVMVRADITLPVITLIGSSTVETEIYTDYIDAGATASDTWDGDITGDITSNLNLISTSTLGSYIITYSVNDAAGNSTTTTRTVNVVDTTSPIITLTGPSIIEIEVGSEYTEQGAIAEDNYDIIYFITGDIEIGGSVLTTTVGSYAITYNVTDASGNSAIEVTRTVNVVDTTIPIITLTGPSTVEIEFGSDYTEQEATATDNYDSIDSITSNIEIGGSVSSTTTVGSYTITYNVTDTSGNSAIEIIRIVNVVDTMIPIITVIGLNPITIEFGSEYNDGGATSTDNYNGLITDQIVPTNPISTTTPVGQYTVLYSVSDSSGNLATTTRIVNIIDTTASTITNNTANELSAGTTETNLTIITDEDAICKYSIIEGTSFASSTLFITTGSTTHSTLIAGLTNGNTYNYYIISQDNYSNTSTTTVSFSVASLPALYCGDGDCNNGETCSTCPADCGRCRRGGGGGRSVTPPKDITPDPLAKISNTTAERTDDSIILNWTNPTDADFKETVIIKLSKSIAPHLSYEDLILLGEVVYQGTDEYYKDLDIEKNIDYYYSIFTVDTNSKYSDSVVIEKKHLFLNNNGTTDYGKIKNLANIPSELVEKISLSEAKIILYYNNYVNLSDANKKLYVFITDKAKRNLSEQNKFAIAFCIHEGSQTTKILGAGERTGVLNSYLSVFGRLPETEADWQDVIKIANGRWPTERNLDAELLANKSHFVKVYLREPNMDNANDNAAVTVITYGLRPADRNLDSEKVAIKTFKHIYGYNPSSAIDWDITRAIAYSGASR